MSFRVKANRGGLRIAWALAALALAGCGGPASLLDAEIKAGSVASFLNWRGRVLETYPKPERVELEEALQELRFVEMGRRSAMSSSTIDALVREKIDGRTVREVLILAYEARWKRVDEELKLMRGVIELNMQRIPVTPEAEVRLQSGLERQVKRQDELAEELARIETRLEALGGRTAPVADPKGASPSFRGGSGAAA